MATIVLVDTGYLKTDNSGTQFTNYASATDTQKLKGDFRVNEGNEIELDGVEMNYDDEANIYDEPTPTLNETIVSKGSSENPKIMIKGVARKKNATASQITETNTLIKNLKLLKDSNGYKELYFNSTTIDTWFDITKALGSTDTQNPTYPHLHIRVTGFGIRNNAGKGLLEYTLKCEITK